MAAASLALRRACFARTAAFAFAAFRRAWVAASAFAVLEEFEVVDPEVEELLERALDDWGRAEEPDELVLGAVALGGAGVDRVEVGVVFTVAVGAGAELTGAGSGFGSAARLAAGKTAAAIAIASMPRMARDATFCCFL